MRTKLGGNNTRTKEYQSWW